ncbi:MAG: hypothetical protein ACOC8F_05290 [Planctomycetota bacterium]
MKPTLPWTWMLPLSLAAAVLGGCTLGPTYAVDERAGFDAVTVADSLAIGIDVPEWTLRPGDSFAVTVAVENRGGPVVEIDAFGDNKCYVGVARHTARGWEQIERYPGTGPELLKTWTLEPGQVTREARTLKVGPAWPSNEVLRIRAWLNGREDVHVTEFVKVAPRSQSGWEW